MQNELFYFGTTLFHPGHGFYRSGFDLDPFPRGNRWHSILPFDPETLLSKSILENVKGHVSWIHIQDWTICYIPGSPADKRNGSKSVFFVKQKISFEELKEIIINNRSAGKIIDSLHTLYGIRWDIPTKKDFIIENLIDKKAEITKQNAMAIVDRLFELKGEYHERFKVPAYEFVVKILKDHHNSMSKL